MGTVTAASLRAREGWESRFLAALRDTGNITASCMHARCHREQAYRLSKRDPAFKAQWGIALEIATDKLKMVARNRAIKGVKKPIYYKGELIDHVYEPSDRLMELLLRAHDPDNFNPVQKLEHSGGVNVSIMQFGGAEVVEGEVVEHAAPGGGASSRGGTPKLGASDCSEGSRIANFSDSEAEQFHTDSKVITDG